MKRYAKVDRQNNVFRLTCLCDAHFIRRLKKTVIRAVGGPALLASWKDVSDNPNCRCQMCGQ